MSSLAKVGRRTPSIRYLSAGLVRDVTAKDFRGEVECIFNFVKTNIRYVQDVNDVETLQTPDTTLAVEYGDCDDMATLLASMLESIGHPSRFAAVGFEPEAFDHVLVQTKIGSKWVSLDATEPYPMGWEPPQICDYLIQFI